jgi:Ca2+-transporting ATPase
VWQHVAWVGLLIAGLCVALQAWAWHGQNPRGQTMVFTLLTLAQMGHVLAIRGERVSLFRQGLAGNLPLLGAVLLTFVLQLLLIYVPALNAIFGTAPLTAGELGLCVGLASVPFFAVEAEKRWVRW